MDKITTATERAAPFEETMQHLNPAEYVIRKFGGVRKAAKAIGRDPGAVSKWRQPKEKRGSGGSIPSAAQRAILKAAAELGLDITADDLINGRTVRTKVVKVTQAVVD